jgi:hypothetical protein
VQRPPQLSGLAFGVERAGNRQRLGIHLEDGAQRGARAVDLFDPRGVQLHEAT